MKEDVPGGSFGPTLSRVGDTHTLNAEFVGGAVTVTFMDDDLVGSALLVAVTTAVPPLEGAVYNPEDAIVPDEAFQVTDLSAAVP